MVSIRDEGLKKKKMNIQSVTELEELHQPEGSKPADERFIYCSLLNVYGVSQWVDLLRNVNKLISLSE